MLSRWILISLLWHIMLIIFFSSVIYVTLEDNSSGASPSIIYIQERTGISHPENIHISGNIVPMRERDSNYFLRLDKYREPDSVKIADMVSFDNIVEKEDVNHILKLNTESKKRNVLSQNLEHTFIYKPQDIKSVGNTKVRVTGKIKNREIVFTPTLPGYPTWAEKMGIEFDVKVKVGIDYSGNVKRAVIIESSGDPDVDTLVEDFVKGIIFESIDSKEIMWGTITVQFRLE